MLVKSKVYLGAFVLHRQIYNFLLFLNNVKYDANKSWTIFVSTQKKDKGLKGIIEFPLISEGYDVVGKFLHTLKIRL